MLAGTAAFLITQAWPAMSHYGPFSFFASQRWAPSDATATSSHPNPYGIVQFIYGTTLISVIAMLIVVPTAVAVALFVTQIAPRWLRRPLTYLTDLLAAIPSVVYGFWGIFALVPALKPVGNALSSALGNIPGVGVVFAGPFFGVSYSPPGSSCRSWCCRSSSPSAGKFSPSPRSDYKEAALARGPRAGR